MSALKPGKWVLIAFAACVATAVAAQRLRAQEIDDETSGDEAIADHHGHHGPLVFHLSGHAKFSFTTCGSDACFTFAGEAVANGKPVTLNGAGTNSNCAPTTSSKTCCDSSGTETIAAAQGSFDFTFTGKSCQKTNAPNEILAVALECTGGTGKFVGATGTGHATANVNATTGKATITASGTLR